LLALAKVETDVATLETYKSDSQSEFNDAKRAYNLANEAKNRAI
jgi:hypothetical protein